MFAKIFPATLGVALLIAPAASAQDNRKPSPATRQNAEVREDRNTEDSRAVQEAIAFERHKDAAAERQIRLEARRASVTDNNADRSATNESKEGRAVKDEKPPKK
jgi:hypothetical protein